MLRVTPVNPPATSTRPSARRVAVWLQRLVVMDPVTVNSSVRGL
jgi:hypothetical protein